MLAVFPQPLFEYFDGRDEVPAEGHQHVNIVPIAVATKTVSEIVAWIDGRAQFIAARTLKAKEAREMFARRRLSSQVADGHLHRQIISDRPEQFRRDHRVSLDLGKSSTRGSFETCSAAG